MSDDNVTKLPICGKKKVDGTPCERIVGAPGQPCYAHDPSRKADRRRSASTAAKSKLSAEIVAIRGEIRRIMEDIRDEEIDRGDGAVLLQGCGLLLKAVAEGRKQSEYDEIRTEMGELRDLFEKQRKVLDYG